MWNLPNYIKPFGRLNVTFGGGKEQSRDTAHRLLGIQIEKMTALQISIFVWTIVALIATDEGCRKHEKRAFRFFIVLGSGLTAVGLWSFQVGQLREISLSDLVLYGLFFAFVFYLRLKMALVKRQSEIQKRSVSVLELELDAIPEKGLVRRFRIVRAIMWWFVALVLLPPLVRTAVILL